MGLLYQRRKRLKTQLSKSRQTPSKASQICQMLFDCMNNIWIQLQYFLWLSTGSLRAWKMKPTQKCQIKTWGNNTYFTQYCSILVTYTKESTLDKLNACKTDIQEDIVEAGWNCLKAQKQTINTRFKLLQYKWLMRMYISPVKLHHMSTNIPDVCTKCLIEKGTLYHCLWECPKIQNFCKDVVKCLSEVINIKLPKTHVLKFPTLQQKWTRL